MKPFRERNLKVVAVISLTVILAVVAGALNFSKLSFLHPVHHFHAELVDAGSLVVGEQVTVAGAQVGTITGLHLAGNHVRLDFTTRPSLRLGSLTTLTVKILSPLGQEYVQLGPQGPGRLDPGATIPQSRTSGTTTILATLNQTGTTLGAIDQAQLARSLEVVTQDLAGTAPAATAAVIGGLGRLSNVIADRQDQLSQLVAAANQVTATLSAHRGQLVDLIGQANLILQVVQQRRSDIKAVLDGTTALAQRVSEIITDKRANLSTLLGNLQTVSSVLARDSGSLTAAIPLLSGLTTYLANATGTGEFFDAIAPTLLINDHLLVQCSKPGVIHTSGGPLFAGGCKP